MERELEGVERIRAEPYQQGGKRPEDMTPQELHSVLWQVLTFRDSVMKKIDKTIGTFIRSKVRIQSMYADRLSRCREDTWAWATYREDIGLNLRYVLPAT